MASTEERLKILHMIEQGTISAADGANLLRAVEQNSQLNAAQVTQTTANNPKPRWLHVQVTDATTGKKKIDINVPLGLVNVGLKMGARFAPRMTEEQHDQFILMIKQAATGQRQGKIYEDKGNSGEIIEVFVE